MGPVKALDTLGDDKLPKAPERPAHTTDISLGYVTSGHVSAFRQRGQPCDGVIAFAVYILLSNRLRARCGMSDSQRRVKEWNICTTTSAGRRRAP